MKIQQQKMKIKNEQQQQHKNLTGGSPKKVTSLGVFDFFKKNYYRSIISITLASNIVLHMLAISTFNKDNG